MLTTLKAFMMALNTKPNAIWWFQIFNKTPCNYGPELKLSNFSKWPLYFVIQKLPFSKCTKGKICYLLDYGLETKPFMLTFSQPFHSSLQKLETKGTPIKVKVRDDTIEMISKVILPVCDMPVKCLVCIAVQYSGSYGCFKCKQRGVIVKVSAQG